MRVLLVVCSWLVAAQVPSLEGESVDSDDRRAGPVKEKNRICELQEISTSPYFDADSGRRRSLSIWYLVNCKDEIGATVSEVPSVRGDYLTSGSLISDGPMSRPLVKILSYSTKITTRVGESPQALVAWGEEILLFWYAPRSCSHGSIGAVVLPYSLKDPGIPYGERLQLKNPKEPAKVVYPRQAVVVEKECGPKRLTATLDGSRVLIDLEKWDGAESLGRFLFVPEESKGCAKWFRVDLDKTRLRYVRPIGAPEEEWDYIKEMEGRCEDF